MLPVYTMHIPLIFQGTCENLWGTSTTRSVEFRPKGLKNTTTDIGSVFLGPKSELKLPVPFQGEFQNFQLGGVNVHNQAQEVPSVCSRERVS